MNKKLTQTNRVLIFNIGGSFVIKACSVLISFLTTPGYIKYFENASVLGVWFTALSILNWIMMFDLGIGNGLRNRLAKSLVEKNQKNIQKQISSAYIILGILSVVLFLVGEVIFSFLNWNKILNVSPDIIDNKVLTLAVMILYGGILLQFWLKLITSILLAMRKNILSGVLMVITNILIVGYLYYPKNIISVEARLIDLSIFYIIALNLPLIFTTIFIFVTKLKDSIPRIKYYDRIEAKKVLNMGGLFFVIQIALLVINSTNEWLVSFLYGAKNVVDYQVYYKIFNLILVLFSLITQPIWSSITIEYEKHNIKWIRKIHKLLIFAVFLSVPILIFVVANFDFLVQIWLGSDAIKTEPGITLSFTLFTLEMIAINSSTCIANGIGKLKCQFYGFVSAAILKFPLSFLVASYSESWSVILWINILVLLPVAIAQPLLLRKFLAKS